MRTLLTALMLFVTPAVAGNFEDAVAAYKAGDYQKAFCLYEPLVERGDAWAQFNLGVMYDHGEGVPEDHAKAVHWYRKAAQQGDAEAQFNFGSMFANGKGVSKNYVQAYAWWSIAATRVVEKATEAKRGMQEMMTRKSDAKARKLVREYWEKNVVPFQKD